MYFGVLNFLVHRGSYLVLVFYPGDWESRDLLKSFSFLSAHFEAKGVQLVGVSTDSVSSHKTWVEASREEDGWGGWLGLHLWSDPSGALATQYDLFDEEEGVCQEGVIVVDREGKVRHAMSTSLGYDETAESVLEVVNLLQNCDIQGVDRLGKEKTFQLADFLGSYLVVVLYSDDWEAFDLLDAFSKLAPKFRKQGVQLAGNININIHLNLDPNLSPASRYKSKSKLQVVQATQPQLTLAGSTQIESMEGGPVMQV